MTTTLHPQFIRDANGKKSFVILTAEEFGAIMEELDDAEDVRLYNEAKKEDTGERIPMAEAFKMIEAKRNNFRWIKQGLIWGFLMFILMTLMNLLLTGDGITYKSLTIGIAVWTIFGLGYGYSMKLIDKKMNSSARTLVVY
jgi:hypothetical protein